MAAKKKSKKPKNVSATYLLPPDVKEEIERQAQEQDTSAGWVVRNALRDWFGKNKENKGE